jgi:sterol desaturase/sphingolipid hydroxylase (fatty acid hydroxylase superfamily)
MGADEEQLATFIRQAASRIGASLHAFVAMPLDPANRFYWLYLLTSLVFGAVAYVVHYARQHDRFSVAGLFRQLFRKEVYAHPSARLDYVIFTLNHLFTPGALATRYLPASWVGAMVAHYLTTAFGTHHIAIGGVPSLILFALALAVVNDFNDFVIHVLLHRVPLLWEFHKLHHSAEVMTPLTVDRLHPMEQVIGGFVTLPIMGLYTGVVAYLLVGSPHSLSIFGVNAVYFAFFTAGQHLRHSDIWLAWPRALSYVLISPAQHQIHHSIAPEHRDHNYGFIFAFWDWAFGSLYVPRRKETLVYGLGDGKPTPHPTILAAYLAPFRGAWSAL